MANSLLKLTVESSEYDAKLKKAAEGIRHLADVAHKGGGELTGLEKAELDYIKALGDMETKSRSAAGQVRELESTYKELKVVYDRLNEVEKADEGGKALAASLETLKQRAQDARKGLEDASKSLQENADAGKEDSSVLEKLASKFTVNIDALKLFDIGLKATKAALDVAKDAFFSSETNVDEWGRTLRSADGIYQSFLQSLNTSDFSGFLNNIGQVTQAAREAYNALDELGTRMTIINPERAKLQARQQELRADIRRNGADSEIGKAALQELKKIEPLLSKSFKTESKMNYNAFEKLVKERLAEGKINLNQKSFNEFMKTFSNDAAFQSLRKNARGSLTTEMTGNAYNPNAVMTRRTVDTRNTEQKLLDLFTDEWRKANSGYLTAAFNAQGAAASNMLGNSRYMKTTSGGGSGGGGRNTNTDKNLDEEQKVQQKINALLKEALTSDANRQGEIRQQVADLQQQQEKYKDIKNLALGILPKEKEAVFTFDGQLSEETKKALSDIKGVTIDDKTMTVTANTQEAMQKVQELIGVVTETKLVPIKPVITDEDVDKQLQKQFGKAIEVPIVPKTRGQQLEQSIRIKLAVENMEADKQTLRTLLETQIKYDIESVEIPTDDLLNKIMGDELDANIPDEYWANLQEQINEKLREMDVDPIDIDFKTGKDKGKKDEKNNGKDQTVKALEDFNGKFSQVTGGIGNIANGIQQLGIELPQGIQDAVSVLTGISSIITGITSILGLILVAQNATAAASWTDAIIPFANGGIVPHAANGYYVPGNHYSNDVTPIMANAGELVLNKSQQGNLASQLSGSGIQNMKLDAVITGEQIRLVLNNNGRRTGRGEYVQTKSGRV